MKSLVLKFADSETVGEVIERIKSSGTNLELSPMSEGNAGDLNAFNQLLVIGDADEIYDKLESSIGINWKSYVIQGEVDEEAK